MGTFGPERVSFGIRAACGGAPVPTDRRLRQCLEHRPWVSRLSRRRLGYRFVPITTVHPATFRNTYAFSRRGSK
jgi:hypothetical protein